MFCESCLILGLKEGHTDKDQTKAQILKHEQTAVCQALSYLIEIMTKLHLKNSLKMYVIGVH